MSTKAKGTSVTQKLANLAKKRGARYEHVATEFLIERLVRRLVADKKLASLLVFKGGFVGLRVYNSSRYTVDLDALLRKSNLEATLTLTREAAETDLDDGVWFRFESQVDLEAQGEYGGIRQTFRAGFGELPKKLLKAQTINFDLGIGDPVSPVSSKMMTLLSNEELSWSVYPIETIIAEKLHALVDRGELNSRSKDVFDLVAFLPKVKGRCETPLRSASNIERRCFQIGSRMWSKTWTRKHLKEAGSVPLPRSRMHLSSNPLLTT
jgi:predicted nucleotidyltransferase component of viral defense system